MSSCTGNTLTRNAVARASRRAPLIPPSQMSFSPRHSHWKISKNSRTLSTENGRKTTTNYAEFPSNRQEALTLLHKTTTLLPRALPSSGSSRDVESLEFWNTILSQAYEDLTQTSEREARIVVYGVDEWAGAKDLVTALLEEPLSSDQARSDLLKNRWKDSRSKLTISPSSTETTDTATIHLPSSYLTQFAVPIQLTELPPHSSTLASSPLEGSSVATLFDADIPILVVNPLTTPLSSLRTTTLPNNTIIVLTSAPSQLVPKGLSSILSHSSTSSSLKDVKILCVDPARAVAAVHSFQTDSSSSTGIRRYQDDFVGSGLPTVTAALRDILALPSSSKGSPSAIFRTRAAVSQIEDALLACETSVQRVREDLDSVCGDVSHLNGRMEEVCVKAEREILGIPNTSSAASDGDEVAGALRVAEKEMKAVMDRLTWWRMAWRVDEISDIVTAGVARSWCPELERKLILHTGRLSALQREFTKSAFSVLSSHDKPPFNSALLRNTLLQLKSSQPYQLSSQALTHPLYTRQNQLIYPTTRLHVAGQRTVLGMSGGVAAGAGVSWAGWLGWLVGSGEGLLGFVGLEPGTAIGVGLLSAVASVRWAVGKWEKSKKKWWKDWHRVGEGLDRDLRTTIVDVIKEKVVVVADSAASGLTAIVETRKQEIEVVHEELEKLQHELGIIKQRTNAKP
ncbi:hypothetical protein BDQ12DRAFT_672816 [Crucibulum laeve]|uniref:Uncharacterized protein n=1 Tax=Crucibulum laeve TaxID=68775 RepID=A0A5C3MG53_9AGAR|nr:hypothetical protein BDQ12DRAFT_672816 [Crucibulum laeve]